MLKIYKTTDYSQFKFVRENREPAPKALIESIKEKNMLEERPILCDLQMHVIDGQNRLKAAQLLQLPVFYMVSPNISVEDIGRCQVQKPWVMPDFARFYSDREEYKFVHEIVQLYGLPIHLVIYCCNPSKNNMKLFRSGSFYCKKDKESLRTKFQELSEIIQAFKEAKKNSGIHELCISIKVERVLWQFINRDDYNHQRLLYKMATYPSNLIPILKFNLDTDIANSLQTRVYDFGGDVSEKTIRKSIVKSSKIEKSPGKRKKTQSDFCDLD